MYQSENLGDILARRLKSRGLDKAALGAWVCGAANKVGEGAAQTPSGDSAGTRALLGGEFTAVSFKDGTLKIRVSSAARSHLIRLQEEEIISKINKELKKDLVKKLRFEIDN